MSSKNLGLAAVILLCGPALSLPALASLAASAAGVGGAVPAAVQPTSPSDPLKTFQAIVGGYKSFFSKSEKLVYGQAYSDSPSGRLVYVIEYAGKDLAYDVRKTDSLVSPFTAYVQLSLRSMDNGSCGTVPGFRKMAGWPDVAGALAQANSPQCFKPLIDGEEFWDQVRFQYAYQDDKWTLVQVLRTQYAKPELAVSAAIGVPAAPGITLADAQAVAFNKAWIDTIIPSQ